MQITKALSRLSMFSILNYWNMLSVLTDALADQNHLNSLHLMSNLVNSKSWGQEVLLRSISNSNCSEEVIKIYNPPN